MTAGCENRKVLPLIRHPVDRFILLPYHPAYWERAASGVGPAGVTALSC